MEKKKYENPELEVIFFEGDLATDVMSTSGDYDEGGWGENPPGGDFDDQS